MGSGYRASPCPGAVLRGPCTLSVELMLGTHLYVYLCLCVYLSGSVCVHVISVCVCLCVPECGISGPTLTCSSSRRCGSPVLPIPLERCYCLLWLVCAQG